MSDDFCLLHGYEYMMREFGNPIPHCWKCEAAKEEPMTDALKATAERVATVLLPCPFCGGGAKLIERGVDSLVTCCTDRCPAALEDWAWLDMTPEAAVAAWNTRDALTAALAAPQGAGEFCYICSLPVEKPGSPYCSRPHGPLTAPAADAVERVYQDIALAYTRETGGADLGRRVGEAMARAALAALPSTMDSAKDGWRTIDSAPRDGRFLLAKSNDGTQHFKIRWGQRENGVYWLEDNGRYYGDGLFGGWIEYPLPAAPVASATMDSAKDGWVLVPREPTEAMRSAFYDAEDPTNGGFAQAYRAMLAAAPVASDDGGKK